MSGPDDVSQTGGRAPDDPRNPIALELDFVPAWARQPPSVDPYRDAGGEAPPPRGRRLPRHERQGGARGPGKSRDRRDESRRPSARRPDRSRPRDPRGPDVRNRRPVRPKAEHVDSLPPIQIAFVPEQDRLAAMVSDVRTSQHAFPLPELAHLFLTRPEWHLVKFESNKVHGGGYAMAFYQVRPSGMLFMDRNDALKSAEDLALEEYFERETVEGEVPSGNFVCVARCRLSGTLLPPPNHHAHNEQVAELHRARFPHLTLDAYRREIETVRDAERIEEWKASFRTRTVYRLKESPEADSMDERQARAWAAEKVAPKNVLRVRRAVLPGPDSRLIRDPALLRTLRAAWAREQRFPVTLIRALRGAFRHMNLHVFEPRRNQLFVTAIPPHPVDPSRVIRPIREVLEWLQAHPGATRPELIAAVKPEAKDDPAQLAEVLQPLTWLIEKGHVIEFYNSTLAVPRQ